MEEQIKNILNWVESKHGTSDIVIRLWEDFSGDVINVSAGFGCDDVIFAFDNVYDVKKEDVDCWGDIDSWLDEK